MTSAERWQRAHKTEKNHSTHDDLPSVEHTIHVMENHGLSWDDFDDTRVLAVGGGTGIIHTIDNASETISVDPISYDIPALLSESTADVITGNGENLPFESDSFDWVLCRNVLDHTMSPSAVLDEIHRVLSPDGSFWFGNNAFRLPKPIRNSLGLVDSPHPHHFSPSEIESLLDDSGFDPYHSHTRSLAFWGQNIKTKVAIAVARIIKVRHICEISDGS